MAPDVTGDDWEVRLTATLKDDSQQRTTRLVECSVMVRTRADNAHHAFRLAMAYAQPFLRGQGWRVVGYEARCTSETVHDTGV